MAERVPARGICVAPSDAEAARQALMGAGVLDPALQPERTSTGAVVFPLVRDADVEGLTLPPGATLVDAVFVARARRVRDYKALLADLPAEARDALPTSYDVVGHAAIVKLPEPVLPFAPRVAAALLEVHPNLRTVARDAGVQGELRVRALEVLAGDTILDVEHREHGLVFEVPIDRAYFSPRLATERQRLAERVQPGDRVLDLFAGVGAFVVLVAKTRAPLVVHAIDLNPHAVAALRRNVQRNHVDPDRVVAVEGDTRHVAPRTGDWDHVVMNLPHDAARFLDVAAACVAPDGQVHLYGMVERDERDQVIGDMEATMSTLMDADWRVVAVRHVRNYSPTMDGLGFTLAARGPAPESAFA